MFDHFKNECRALSRVLGLNQAKQKSWGCLIGYPQIPYVWVSCRSQAKYYSYYSFVTVISNIPRYSKHLKSWYSMTWPFSFRTWYGPPSDGQRWPQEASQWRQSWTIASFPAGKLGSWRLLWLLMVLTCLELGRSHDLMQYHVPCLWIKYSMKFT